MQQHFYYSKNFLWIDGKVLKMRKGRPDGTGNAGKCLGNGVE